MSGLSESRRQQTAISMLSAASEKGLKTTPRGDPSSAQAGRIAKEASAQFGEPAAVEFEGALYKVRVRAFASEGSAQSLRERAVDAGYPGAFRMRSAAP